VKWVDDIPCLSILKPLKGSDLQAEKRGNFVVIGCVEGSRVVSWSLNVSFLRLFATTAFSDQSCDDRL
jgi:hypothetical protein